MKFHQVSKESKNGNNIIGIPFKKKSFLESFLLLHELNISNTTMILIMIQRIIKETL